MNLGNNKKFRFTLKILLVLFKEFKLLKQLSEPQNFKTKEAFPSIPFFRDIQSLSNFSFYW